MHTDIMTHSESVQHLQSVKLAYHPLKALVWFWLIDKTLSANLVYQSNHEIGSTTPSDETNKDHDMMMVCHGDDQVLGLGKKKEKNKKLKAKV